MFGDPAVTGKSADDDLREGKQTLLDRAGRGGRGRRRPPPAAPTLLGNPDAGAEQFDAAARSSSSAPAPAPAWSERIAEQHRRGPRRAIAAAPLADDARAALDALAVAATTRTA